MSKLKKLLVTSLSAALLGAGIVPVAGAMLKASATEDWSAVEIAEEYLVDEKINVPGRTLTIGNQTYEASIKMTYPGGVTKVIDDGEMVLSAPGEYTITYEVRVNGTRYSEEEDFFVANKLWSVKNEKSSVEYGTVGATSGLLVRLAKGDTLTFNKIVDLADYDTKQDLIKGFINPDSVGSNDFEAIIIKITDAYDPTQVLTVRGYKSSGSVNAICGSYWTAAGPSQTLGGWDSNGKRFATKIDTVDGICGTYRNTSFCSVKGTYNNAKKIFEFENVIADSEVFSVQFDQTNKTVSVSDRTTPVEVADLDKPEYYDTEPLWKGFTSGKVNISVTADVYAGETANFAITKVFGYDSLDVENKFKEEDDPIITVDVEDKYVEYNEVMNRYSFAPLAVVGGKYPVPQATAFDGYCGDVEVEVAAYFDYLNSKQPTTIKNGTLDIKYAGDYAVVYTAKDHMGNVAERIYWIKAVTELDNPLALTVENTGATVNAVCGEAIELAPYTTAGGSGEANVTITATCGDATVDATKGVLIAEKAGTWTITYKATDYAGISVTESYEVTVTLGDKPVFVETPVLPRYFISEMEYTVPTVYAYDYTSGSKVQKVAELVLTDANGTNTYQAGQNYTPMADANGEIEMSFACEGATLPIDAKIVSPCSGSRVYIENMLIRDGFTVERDSNGLTLTSEVDGSFSWLFANAIAAESAALHVKGIKNYSVFDGLDVTFTDYADSSISVTMKVRHNENGNLQVKFGDTDRELTKGLNKTVDSAGKALNEVSFTYKLGKFYVDGLGVTVTVDDNGNAFNGFPSGMVYLSSEAVGVKAGQQYIIKQIDNHIIGKAAKDYASPKIAVNGEYGGIKEVNSTYVVASAFASDVIDPNVTSTVTVLTPNGEVVTDENGLALDNVPATKEYVIKLTEYGQYQVRYVSVDWTGQEGALEYAVNVFDQKAPKASIKGEWSATAKVGDTVVLPEIQISDDSSSFYEMTVYRMVRNPFDVLTTFGYDYTLVKEGENTPDYTGDDREYWLHTTYKFTFKYAGEYKFIIIVCDAAGNQTYMEYVVTVS